MDQTRPNSTELTEPTDTANADESPAPFALVPAARMHSSHTENTHLLVIPQDALRLWSRHGHDIHPRPRDEAAPPQNLPAGWLLPDGTVVLERQVSAYDLEVVRALFTGPMATVNDTADMPPEYARYARSYSCRLCENASGKMHARSCAHAGKRVGDLVR